MPGHAARRSSWRCVLHNCREFTFGEFGSGITKNTRRARSTFLQDCNPVLYHLRHTFLVIVSVLNTRFPILVYYTILYYTILYYTILYYTILYYTILYYTILYHTILYYTILYYTILYYTILYYTILYYTILYYTIKTKT